MGFKTQKGFQFTGSDEGLKYVSGKRISFYISEQGIPASSQYSGTPGIVSTDIVLDLNATISSSYGGSGTTWSDISGNSNDGTLVNGVSYSSDNGGYFLFDGTNDVVTFSSYVQPAYTTSTSFTWFIWLYPFANTNAVVMGNRYPGLGFTKLTTNNFEYYSANFGGTITLNEWQNICITKNGTSFTYYKNGSSIATITSGITKNSNPFFIGGDTAASDEYSNIRISKLAVYTEALTASEVLQNYNATKSNYLGIITTNLVLHLDASNTSSYGGSGTTWSDISGNSNNLTLTNGPTFNSQDGGAIIFDGSNDYAISAINQSFFQFGTGDYSYGLWVKFDTRGDHEAALSSGSSNLSLDTDNGSWQLSFQPTTHTLVSALGVNSSTSLILDTGFTPSTGTWYYLFVVNDRSENELKFYINGSLNTTDSDSNYGSLNVGNFSNDTSSYNAFIVGRNRNQNQYMDGTIAQVHVYKGKALSASEVLQNYNATKGNFLGAISTTDLVFYLDASKSMSYSGSGTTWTDLSSSSNNGTLTNGPTFDSGNGGSIVFDGTDDYVQCSSAIFNPNANFTISAWINLDATSGNFTIVSDRNNSGRLQLQYRNSNAGQGVYIIDNNIVDVGSFSNSAIVSTGTWYNITVTRSSNTYTLYIDGSSISTFTSTNVYDAGPSAIGINIYGSEKWDGKIAQVFAYSSALSASDVLANYNATKSNYV